MGAEPAWSPLRRATRVADLQAVFAWTTAHRLPDGTRIDVYVHRRTHRAVHLDPLGRSWTVRGFAPGAIGVSLLLEPGPAEDLATARPPGEPGGTPPPSSADHGPCLVEDERPRDPGAVRDEDRTDETDAW